MSLEVKVESTDALDPPYDGPIYDELVYKTVGQGYGGPGRVAGFAVVVGPDGREHLRVSVAHRIEGGLGEFIHHYAPDQVSRLEKELTRDILASKSARYDIPALERIFDPVADVEVFHRKFNIDYDGPPRRLPRDLWVFRTGFMREEAREYRESGGDLAKELDALVDLVYVALGTAHLQGFNFREAWRRVHEANMKKVRAQADGSDSARGSSHDVVKPEGWEPPDHSDLVRAGPPAPRKTESPVPSRIDREREFDEKMKNGDV